MQHPLIKVIMKRSPVILRRSQRISSLIFLVLIALQFPTTLKAGEHAAIQIRHHPEALPSATAPSPEEREQQWSEVTRLVTQAQTNEGAALIRQHLLASNINLVGPWRDVELTIPSVNLRERLSRRGLFVYIKGVLDFLQRPLTREGGFRILREMRNQALLSGWGDSSVQTHMNARYGSGFLQRGRRWLAGQRGGDRLISTLTLPSSWSEEAKRALRLIAIYDDELRVQALTALSGNRLLRPEDLELIHYCLYGFDSEATVLAAITACFDIYDPDTVFLLATKLRQIRQGHGAFTLQEKLIQGLGAVGRANRSLAIESLTEITAGITDYEMPMTLLQREAYVALGKLEAFNLFPQNTSLFFGRNSWPEIAGDLGMTVAELAEVVDFDQRPEIIVDGETVNSQNLLVAFREEVHGYTATDLDVALRRALQRQSLPPTTLQELELRIPNTVELLQQIHMEGHPAQLVRIPLLRLLTTQIR